MVESKVGVVSAEIQPGELVMPALLLPVTLDGDSTVILL
jgi:hypothetical protein